MFLRQVASHCHACSRHHSTLSPSAIAALDSWIASTKQLVIHDTLRVEHLSDLYITLPTRDGTRQPCVAPKASDSLGYGHHLAFFHPRNPESVLRSDGTDADFSPPEPFTRRMWAGGKMEWHKPLLVGSAATAASTIQSVDKKHRGTAFPHVFVKQNIRYSDQEGELCVEEERSHVFLSNPGSSRPVREVLDLPHPEFSLSFRPTPTTLFRFSALTFNGHRIHLDKEFARNSEGYAERLVHGPLTALMLLETLALHQPGRSFKLFEYRAQNPLIVDRPILVCGAREDAQIFRVWATNKDGVVGMTGTIATVE